MESSNMKISTDRKLGGRMKKIKMARFLSFLSMVPSAGLKPAEVTMNRNERNGMLFPVLSYLVAITLVGVSVDHNDVEM